MMKHNYISVRLCQDGARGRPWQAAAVLLLAVLFCSLQAGSALAAPVISLRDRDMELLKQRLVDSLMPATPSSGGPVSRSALDPVFCPHGGATGHSGALRARWAAVNDPRRSVRLQRCRA
jgi:hypothetical protein